MAVDRSAFLPKRREDQFDAIANRLRESREGMGLTQTEVADQISVSRDRLACYEDGRSILRCDVALRVCRQLFINEFWLALGSVNEQKLKDQEAVKFSIDGDTRLTMALAVEPAALACPPGISFADGFDPFLRQSYSRLAVEQRGFPRIAPLPSDGPEYFTNALNCMVQFWRRGLSPDKWRSLFSFLVSCGHSGYSQVLEGKLDFKGSALPPTLFVPSSARSMQRER
jgi:transcriptional regulator with XRE-family HTH domain